jgi:hypothetical protein
VLAIGTSVETLLRRSQPCGDYRLQSASLQAAKEIAEPEE